MLAARRDIGDAETITTIETLLALRLQDYYEAPDNVEAMKLPLNQVFERFGWVPPWREAPSSQTGSRP